MSESNTEPQPAQGLTEAEQAMLDREFEEFRKLLSEYARFVTKYPEVMESLRENLAFSAKYVVSNRAEFVDEYRDAYQRLDRFLEEFEQGNLDPRDFILDSDGRAAQGQKREG